MVMERLRGRTLGAAMRETRQRARPWTPGNTFAVASQVAEGLYRAHAHVPAIVHRDIKPENIYLHRSEGSFESVVKVMDFGVAALVGEQDRALIGTPRYMAPEQVEGGRLSAQTDQYALALVVYEMLTGRLPWEARGAKALADVRLALPPASAMRFCKWLPEEVDDALLKALSRDPANRHESVHKMMFELRALQWASEHTTGSGDHHSTVPMVGTIAEGRPPAADDRDTLAQASIPPVEGPPLEVFGSSSDGVDTSAQVTQHYQGRPTTPEGRQGDALRTPTIPVFEDAEPEALGAGFARQPDTPMGAEVAAEGRNAWRKGMGRVGSALVATGVAAAALGGLALVTMSGRSSARVAQPAASVAVGVASAPAPTEKAKPQAAAEDPGSGAASLPAWLEPSSQPAADRVASSPQDAGAAAVRKPVAPATRSPARAVSVVTRVPDDGRDELYVPGGR
jgi:serine/threonine-protein kinase